MKNIYTTLAYLLCEASFKIADPFPTIGRYLGKYDNAVIEDADSCDGNCGLRDDVVMMSHAQICALSNDSHPVEAVQLVADWLYLQGVRLYDRADLA